MARRSTQSESENAIECTPSDAPRPRLVARVAPRTSTGPTAQLHARLSPQHPPRAAPTVHNAPGPTATPAVGPHARQRVVLADITPAFVPAGHVGGEPASVTGLGTRWRRDGHTAAESEDGSVPRTREEGDCPAHEKEDQQNEFEVWVDTEDNAEQAGDHHQTTAEDEIVAIADVDERISLSIVSASNTTEIDTAAPTPEPASTTADLDVLNSKESEGDEDKDDEEDDEDDADKENDAAAAAYPLYLHPHRAVHGIAHPPPPPPAPAPAPAPTRTHSFPSLSTVTGAHHRMPIPTPPTRWLPVTPALPGVLSAAAARIDALIAAGAHPSANQLRMRAEDADLRALIEKARRRRGAWAVSPVSSDDEGCDSESEEWEVSDVEESEESSSEDESSEDESSEASSEDDGESKETCAAPSSPGKRKRELEKNEGKRAKAHW